MRHFTSKSKSGDHKSQDGLSSGDHEHAKSIHSIIDQLTDTAILRAKLLKTVTTGYDAPVCSIDYNGALVTLKLKVRPYDKKAILDIPDKMWKN